MNKGHYHPYKEMISEELL
ncbi:unnamed protein product, partial [Rotaria sp. Silwood1]